MKKILLAFLILALLFIFIAYRNTNPGIIISGLAHDREIQKRDLKYKIYLLGVFPIGEAILKKEAIEEYKGQKVYHLNASAKSLEIFSKFFSAQAVLDSYIDAVGFNPLLFKQKVKISDKPDISKEIFYDQKNNIMEISGTRRQIFANTQDPLSLVFNLRRIDFGKANKFEMNINTNQKNYLFKANAEQKGIFINKKAYKLSLIKSTISRRDKNPYHRSSVTVWLLENREDKLPLLIRVFASGFLIHTKLTNIIE